MLMSIMETLVSSGIIESYFNKLQSNLVLDAAIGMMKKVSKDLLSQLLLWGSCLVMLLSDIFAWNFSTISLMLVCAVISLTVFFATRKKGGEAK